MKQIPIQVPSVNNHLPGTTGCDGNEQAAFCRHQPFFYIHSSCVVQARKSKKATCPHVVFL